MKQLSPSKSSRRNKGLLSFSHFLATRSSKFGILSLLRSGVCNVEGQVLAYVSLEHLAGVGVGQTGRKVDAPVELLVLGQVICEVGGIDKLPCHVLDMLTNALKMECERHY